MYFFGKLSAMTMNAFCECLQDIIGYYTYYHTTSTHLCVPNQGISRFTPLRLDCRGGNQRRQDTDLLCNYPNMANPRSLRELQRSLRVRASWKQTWNWPQVVMLDGNRISLGDAKKDGWWWWWWWWWWAWWSVVWFGTTQLFLGRVLKPPTSWFFHPALRRPSKSDVTCGGTSSWKNPDLPSGIN